MNQHPFTPVNPDNKAHLVIKEVCAPKYLEGNETHRDAMARIAQELKDDDHHFDAILPILRDQRFLPAGRIQASAGAARQTTAFNCYVSDTIEDSRTGIFQRLLEAAETMGLGGGDGFDFSTIRPNGALIKTSGSKASGPVSYMKVWDTMCATIASAGNRRGAMMGCLEVSHPDIEEFIDAKREAGQLTNFNISVLVTDEFIRAVRDNEMFDLRFDGVVFKSVSAQALWNKIMRSTWSHAEPGVLFIDRINQKNNLQYCETIRATNPCGEQPLPPNGACLLGSINLTKYVCWDDDSGWYLNFDQLKQDIPHIHAMMDNVIDTTIYPLEAQEIEAKNKRRMGLGVTGVANAIELLGFPYGSPDMIKLLEQIMTVLRDEAYRASIKRAELKGSFPAFDKEKFLESPFVSTLPEDIREGIAEYGIRNSHLLSVAPTGTISLFAGNISSGIEPPFSLRYERRTIMPDGSIEWWPVYDYAYDQWGVKGKTSGELTAQEHINVLCAASRLVDSACSKTCNVGDEVSYEEFKDLYLQAYDGGASGCTTFRPASIEVRGSVMREVEEPVAGVEGAACFIDPVTGERSCSE